MTECVAMHCPQYKSQHEAGSPGCCINEEGRQRDPEQEAYRMIETGISALKELGISEEHADNEIQQIQFGVYYQEEEE